MAPNFYVHITLVQPYANTANDLPLRLYGVQRIKVENPDSHLTPVIQLPDVIHPEEPFLVKISEKSGKPMTYTLAIVDEGLLDLTAFKTPNPWDQMYKSEALGVKTWDLYDQVVGAITLPMVLTLYGETALWYGKEHMPKQFNSLDHYHRDVTFSV